MTSSALVTSFSDYFPAWDSPEPFPHKQLTHAEYVDYLHRYADHFGVTPRIRFSCEVVDVVRTADGRWDVTVQQRGTVERSTHRFDAVAVCSGLHRLPQVPDLPGLEGFGGQVVHSAHYRGPARFAGQSVLFVGAGESGSDVIDEVSRVTRRSYVSLRRGVFVLPRMLNGLPNDYTGTRLLYSLPEFVSRRSDPQARLTRRRLTLSLLPLAVGRLLVDRVAGLLKALSSRPAADPGALLRDVERLIAQLREGAGGNQFETFATKTDAFLTAVVEGRCELRGGLRELTEGGVVFDDGTQVEIDAVVLCTGFQAPSAPFLSEPVDMTRLYKMCFDPEVGDSLAFVGFLRPPIGAIPPLAEMQARWFARICSGGVGLPEAAGMRAIVDREKRARDAYFRQVYDRLPNLVDFSTYLDDIATLIGCKPRLTDLARHPRLLYKVYTAAFSGTQYRLRGPHAQPELARRVLLHAHSHVRFVRFFDLAGAEAARLLGLRQFQPHLTLAGQLRPSRHKLVA